MSNISIAGNTGSDLTLRYAQSGNAFITVPVAVTTGRDDTKKLIGSMLNASAI